MINFRFNFHIRRFFAYLGIVRCFLLFWYGCTKNICTSFFRFICSENDGSCNVTIRYPDFIKVFREAVFLCANTYGNYIVINECCIAHHDGKMCFLPNERYHNILKRDNNELLQKLDGFCFNYQHVDCLYRLFKYQFSGKIVENGQIFDNLQRAVHFNHQNRGVGRIPSISNTRLLTKKYKKHLLSSFQKTKSTQACGSVFADRMKIKRLILSKN